MVMAEPFDISLLPNVLELQPKAHLMIGFGVAFLVLVWLSVALRIYVRLFMIRAFGWDDGMLLISTMTFSSFCACLIVEARYCRSPEVEQAYLTANLDAILIVLTHALKYVVVYNALYILTTILFKISLAVFFLRIVVLKWQRRIIYLSTGIYTLYSVIFIFLVTFRCGSPSDLLINASKGKCISNEAIMPLVYISGALNAAADVVFATLPVVILWNSHMPRQAKVSVGILLSMGCLGSVASIIRMAYLGGLSVDAGFFKHAIDAGLLSVVEPGLAITAASLSALRPLFKSMVEQTLPTFFHTGYGRTKNSTAGNSKRRRSHRVTRSRASFEDQKGFQVFDNSTSRTHTVIATSPRIEMDELSNDDITLNRQSSQGSLVEQHMYETARTWVPPYSGKGVMMTRAINVTEH
ncbi:hypothetical protein E4T38_09286 [Aureobasidium subglaciale]|nr:hypothetical protein E4T38_09286 [Aureobasidium subglaciale]KAI5214101.1 hypothetical protein E4T40_09237 [Aureobasidium subglaciale]KAI5216487.1 hypothetical protein E4T41_09238 [Aureobasidium subglaciale]KAI5254425.1 hypothetical protein E4T46_09193 [Aureobasidium subglaciale]